MNASRKPIVYIISAPSGSGKSTLVNKILKLVPNLDFSISYTTRVPRGSEQNGKQYHFIRRDEFESMIATGEFLEHANVFEKNLYGTARRFLTEAERKSHDLLLDIDVQGAEQVKQKLPDAVTIFVLPPDRKTLERRLRARGENDEETIQDRLMAATREIENYDKYDYILINDDLQVSTESLLSIVVAERLARSRATLSSSEKAIIDLADQCRLVHVRERVLPILASFGTSVPSARP
jgi:guanylate kinase